MTGDDMRVVEVQAPAMSTEQNASAGREGELVF